MKHHEIFQSVISPKVDKNPLIVTINTILCLVLWLYSG